MQNQPLEYLNLPMFFLGERPLSGMMSAQPLLGCDFHYDTFDLRSKGKRSGQVSAATPILQIGGEEIWPKDLLLFFERVTLRPLPPSGVEYESPERPIDPESLINLKDAAIRSVLYHYRLELFFNQNLGVYSHADESLDEFRAHCFDLCLEEFQNDLDSARLKHARILESVIQMTSRQVPHSDDGDPVIERLQSVYRTLTQNTRDALARLFINIHQLPDYEQLAPRTLGDEIAEDFENCYKSAWIELRHLAAKIEHRAAQVDRYEFPLKYGDLVLDQMYVLWKPVA
jgi:hypothetical protein